MKKIFLVAFVFSITWATQAQIFDGITYQAVALDEDGKEIVGRDIFGGVIAENQISIRFSIIESTIDGEIIYQEIHDTFTDNTGLFTVVIGKGELTPIGINERLIDIDWGNNKKFLQVEIDIDGTGEYNIMGTQQMLAVPFAYHALTAATTRGEIINDTNEIQDLQLDGSILSITKNGNSTSIDLSVYLDNTDTHLTEDEVDTYVANNNYLTSEVDASITNEIQDLELSGNTLKITNNADATDIDLSFVGTSAAKEWCLLSLSANQTDIPVAGDPIQWDVVEGNITLSNFKLTLKADKVYELSAYIFLNGFSAILEWYNTTDNTSIGKWGYSNAQGSVDFQKNIVSTIIKPTTDIEVELRYVQPLSVDFVYSDYTHGVVREL